MFKVKIKVTVDLQSYSPLPQYILSCPKLKFGTGYKADIRYAGPPDINIKSL